MRPRSQLVVLGASNLLPDLSALAAAARRALGEAVDVVAACGHGRAYTMASRWLLVRSLPSILDAHLWPALAAAPALPTRALITDIGNDLAYGAGVRQVVGAVEVCLGRLAALDADVALVLPPVARLEALARWQFEVARRLLFPGRDLPWQDLLERVRGVAGGLRDLAGARGIDPIVPARGWYGVDPIHLHAAGRLALRRAVLSRWQLDPDAAGGAVRHRGLRLTPGAHSRWLGIGLGTAQPARHLADGSAVWLY